VLISSGSARDWHFGQRNVAAGFKHDAHATPDDAPTTDADDADEKEEDIPIVVLVLTLITVLNQRTKQSSAADEKHARAFKVI